MNEPILPAKMLRLKPVTSTAVSSTSDPTSSRSFEVSETSSHTASPPSPRSEVRRHPERASYHRELIHEILDAGKVCHVGFVHQGEPVVIPMGYGRQGDFLVLHGAKNSRALQTLAAGAAAAVAVTHLDGLVLARSTFHHSMNYRSVVILGRGEEITDPREKCGALDALVEHLVPGRSGEVRPSSSAELAATLLIRLPITEASAKIRIGGPADAKGDRDPQVWAGVVPLSLAAGSPVPDDLTDEGLMPPASVARLLDESAVAKAV